MIIKKILNNNVAIALNTQGQECVVTGKGIAFEHKIGDAVNPARVEKIFSPQGKGVAEKLSRIVENIPLDHIRVCDEIINMAKQQLSGELSEKIYLTLIDHVAFAIERHKDGVDLTSSLKWEMQQFYRDEYRVGLMALDIIDKRLALRLPEDEAAFIAFHLVNAGSGAAGNSNVEEGLVMIRDILVIVRQQFSLTLHEDSLSYNRFLTHLKYFSRRVLGPQSEGADDIKRKISESGLLLHIQSDMPDETACADKIADYIQTKYSYDVNADERLYLIIHIHSMLTR